MPVETPFTLTTINLRKCNVCHCMKEVSNDNTVFKVFFTFNNLKENC